jgi:hypothetical protein
MPEVPFTPEVWFVLEELVHPYTFDKLGVFVIASRVANITKRVHIKINLFIFVIILTTIIVLR